MAFKRGHFNENAFNLRLYSFLKIMLGSITSQIKTDKPISCLLTSNVSSPKIKLDEANTYIASNILSPRIIWSMLETG